MGRCLIADVGTGDGNRRMVEAALERHGRLDILILNAGSRQLAESAPAVKEPVPSWVGERQAGPAHETRR